MQQSLPAAGKIAQELKLEMAVGGTPEELRGSRIFVKRWGPCPLGGTSPCSGITRTACFSQAGVCLAYLLQVNRSLQVVSGGE